MITFLNCLFSVVAGLLIIILSVFFIIIDWWLLLVPVRHRNKVARYVLIVPWCFIVNHIIFCMRLKVIGRENIDKNRTTIYICNHQSWVDASTYGQVTPAASLAKSQVKSIFMVGILVMYAGALFVNKEAQSSRLGVVKLLMKNLKDGVSVCFFPEGTRSRDGSLLKPNLNLVRLAYKLKVPVVPSSIEGSKEVLKRGRPYFRFFRKVVIKYCEPVLPDNFGSEEEFALYCWEQVKQAHDEILQTEFGVSATVPAAPV